MGWERPDFLGRSASLTVHVPLIFSPPYLVMMHEAVAEPALLKVVSHQVCSSSSCLTLNVPILDERTDQ